MRKGALFTALAIVAGSFTFTTPANAAPGDFTQTTASTTIPSGSGITTLLNIVRVPGTSELIVTGNAGTNTNLKMWKLKADRTVDTTFGTNGVVDLGAALAVVGSTNVVSTSYSTLVNQRTQQIFLTARFTPNGTYNSVQIDGEANIIAQLDLKSGAITSTWKQLSYTTIANRVAWATSIGFEHKLGDVCTSAYGATVTGIALTSAMSGYQLYNRPDGGVLTAIDCFYSNGSSINGGSPGVYKERQGSVLIALKPSGSSMVLDTTFGTNGYLAKPGIDTGCGYQYLSNSDPGVTTLTSTSMFAVLTRSSSAFTTTSPSWLSSYVGATGYEGCYSSGGASDTATSYPMLANGTLKSALTLPAGVSGVGSFVIDPGGRWVGIVFKTSGVTRTSYALRILNTGVMDTSFGTNGAKEVSLPSTVTLNGGSRPAFAVLSGMITTLDEVYFSGFFQHYENPVNSCTGTYGTYIRPFVLSLKTGALLSSYAENGLGKEFSQSRNVTTCGDRTNITRFISSTGKPTAITGSGSSMVIAEWESVTGATGGGDGGTGTGGKTNDTGGKPFGGEGTGVSNVDTKVYTKLPKDAATNLAFRAMTRAEAKSSELVSLTPKVCITFNRSILTINPGRCRVEVRDQATDEVLRKLTTIVKDDGSTDTGSTAEELDPILFSETSAKLSKTARAQLKELVDAAKDAGTIVIVGHSASLTDNEAANRLISLNRARNVRLAMIKAGVKVPIQVVGLGSKAPAETKKSAKAQADNRRVEIYLLPAATPAS